MILLQPVTSKNYLECLRLQVSEEQRDFVASNAFSLAQSKYKPEYIPLAIMNGKTIVGFCMHGIDQEDNTHWILRLMIDKRYQRKGYGMSALGQIIDKISSDHSRSKILTSIEPFNKVAEKIFIRAGFRPANQKIDGEKVLQYDYGRALP